MPAPNIDAADKSDARARILNAAFEAFAKSGYAAATTAEIARRARVSKRDIYALYGGKRQMLFACIAARARRFEVPGDLPVPRDRHSLARGLAALGARLVREISDPVVVGVFRLAIAELPKSGEAARTLDFAGRKASRAALIKFMSGALDAGLIEGRPAECAEQFHGLLWGSLMVSLLLGVAKRPTAREAGARARAAATAFLELRGTSAVRASGPRA